MIQNADGPNYQLDDCSIISSSEKIEVHFRNLKSKLLQHIEEADAIVGCIAWLTDRDILKGLSEKRACSILIQKEDFLRPDSINNHGLQQVYNSIRGGFNRDDYSVAGTRIYGMSCCCDPDIEAIRCVGHNNFDKKSAFPRMHHKFLVFLKVNENDPPAELAHYGPGPEYIPYKVWTGSFNFTYNSSNSLENAVVILGDTISNAYFREWGCLAAISEPLDWRSHWIRPEWRDGT